MTQELLLDQFDLVWALADLHLGALTEDDFLWAATSLSWTVRPDTAGDWRPDWADTEPDPAPVPTIAWLTWLLAPAAFPWPADAGRTVGHMVSWCNVELTKNVAEIGQLRLIRAVSP
jgi:hypothetical protein